MPQSTGNEARARHEIQGVLTHEMVHCFQYNAKETCPGGLIEGIAGAATSHLLQQLLLSFGLYFIDTFQILYVSGPPLTLHTGSAMPHLVVILGMQGMTARPFSSTGLRCDLLVQFHGLADLVSF